jgi:hypothetical protein
MVIQQTEVTADLLENEHDSSPGHCWSSPVGQLDLLNVRASSDTGDFKQPVDWRV